ncbi:unnamed protein product [Diamesa tonsa]
MEIICCGKTTRLLSFPDLNPITAQQHPDKNVSSSINSFKKNCFQQIYKTSDSKFHNLEFMILKKDLNGAKHFEKLLRLRHVNLSAAACGNNESKDFATGYSCGSIKLFELDKASTVVHKFVGDPRQKMAVQFLDYNIGNEYLASVYENGIIDIFGLKTKIKFHTITLDKNSVVARFNPAKRFHLSVASYSGAVTVYDIQTKKIHFQQKDAHSAPCRDIAVPLEVPDRLISVGFDSTIKIFDTRVKRAGLCIEASCPFSSIDTTPCGSYFVVGNLKGEVISYDIRSIKTHLASFRAEDSAINRVIFVTNSEKDLSMMSKQSNSPRLSTSQEPIPSTATNKSNEYLMIDEVISHQRRVSDFSTSFQSRVSMRESTSSRISDNFGLKNVGNMLNDLSDDLTSFDDLLAEESSTKSRDDSYINSERLKKRTTKVLEIHEKPRVNKRISSVVPNLENINEEVATMSESDKENNSSSLNSKSKNDEDEFVRRLSSFGNQFNLLDAKAKKEEDDFLRRLSNLSNPEIKITSATSNSISKENLFEQSETDGNEIVGSISTPQMSADMKDEFKLMRSEMNAKFSELYQLINYDLAGNHLDLTTYIFNVKRELQQKMKMVEECVGMLMLDNPIINQVLELQEENQNLRNQLNDLRR